MAYSNSPLATYMPLGKNHYSSRNAILGIIPHCVVGHGSASGVYGWFKSNDNASSNYYIDDNGKIYCFVDEKYGAWTTSNYNVDMNHITVEIASDSTSPYAMTDKAYEALIKLTADVYKRNGISECKWNESKAYDYKPGYVPMHRNYKIKECPGNWLVAKYRSGDFCKRVNALLKGEEPVEPKQTASTPINDFGIKYRAHCETIGDCPEVHDGQIAGTVGFSKRLEELHIICPDSMEVSAKAHIQRDGWVTYPAAKELTIGTRGESKRLEAIELTFTGVPEGKQVKYQVQCQTIGWMDPVTNGYPTGTMGQSKRIEAVAIWCE